MRKQVVAPVLALVAPLLVSLAASCFQEPVLADTCLWSMVGTLPIESVSSLVINPLEPERLYLTSSYYAGGTYSSLDGGVSWDRLGGGAVTSIAFDPGSPSTFYVSTLAVGSSGVGRIMRTTNRGDTWETLLTGRSFYCVAVDPANPLILYAVDSNHYWGGVYKSVDGGISWQKKESGLVSYNEHKIVVDTQSPNVLYLCTFRDGIFKSTDGAETWRALENGPKGRVDDVLISPTDQNVLYATNSLSFRSSDGGETWTSVSDPLAGTGISVLASDPGYGGALYAITQSSSYPLYCTGIFSSVDGAVSWQPMTAGLPDDPNLPYVRAVLPRKGGGLYACTEGSLWINHEAPCGIDRTPPGRIKDLAARTASSAGNILLTWTAPGDDELLGTAAQYAVRCGPVSITEDNWDQAWAIAEPPTPGDAGTQESLMVSDLVPGQTYYFAVRASDEEENVSAISNSPSAVAAPYHFITGAVTTELPWHLGVEGSTSDALSVPLPNLCVELLCEGEVVEGTRTVTTSGYGTDGGKYVVRLDRLVDKPYRVRVMLTETVGGRVGYDVMYVPENVVPWIESPEFMATELVTQQDVLFSQDTVAQGGATNLPSTEMAHLSDLAAIFYHIGQAKHMALDAMGITSLNQVSVRAFAASPDTGYEKSDQTIVISATESTALHQYRPYNREWHEYFHHVMAGTNDVGLGTDRSCRNHGGFLNSTTEDSWVEAWAEVMPMVMVDQGYVSRPGQRVGYYGQYMNLEPNPSYLPWTAKTGNDGTLVQREEFALAALLWDMYDPESNADHDHLALGLSGMRDLLLASDGDGGYEQIHTVRDVYTRTAQVCAAEKVDELFEAHGFYADKGWVLDGCTSAAPGEDSRSRQDGEDMGYGGREEQGTPRTSFQEVSGAYVLLNLQDQSGQSVDQGALFISLQYPPPYDVYDTTVYDIVYNGQLYYLELPPREFPMTVELRGAGPSGTYYSATNDELWDAVAASDLGYVADITLVVDDRVCAPVLFSVASSLEPVMVGSSVAASAHFAHLQTGETHTATWDWGDGNVTVGDVTEADGSGAVMGSHIYAVPGVYRIILSVADDEGRESTAAFEYVVVYDPEGGFVTGGGWVMSPEGAYTADPSLTGKASFGFVSKYKKGATAPTGQTQFQFKAGDLNFHSDSYQWLVVAGAKAKYKGVGTINGEGNYGFMISVIDAKLAPSTDVDLFRIKIWDRDAGDAPVYDNQLGAEENADPTTALGVGSIVVHK